MAKDDKKVKMEVPATQSIRIDQLELPEGDELFTVELAEVIPAGKKAVVSGHLYVNVVDA